MKVNITFDFGPDERAAIGSLTGHGHASHAACRRWIESTVRSTLESVLADYERTKAEDAAEGA